VALQPIHQPPQDQDLIGQGGISQPVQIHGRQPIHGHCQGRQVIRSPGPQPGRLADRMCVRVHGRNLPTRHENTTTNPQSGDNLLHPPHQPTIQGQDTGFVLPTW
jgi:hypothetical protein